MENDMTIVISSAGMGTRLGLGITKALVDIDGKPLIIHQLEMLKNYTDIWVVVGYQAEKVIEVVKGYRNEISFAFNYDYKTTGTGASFSKVLMGGGSKGKHIVAFDGDIMVHPDDLERFLKYDGECIGACEPTTDNPVLMVLNDDSRVIEFSRTHGSLEWTGLAKLRTDRLRPGIGHVYEMIEPLLPVDALKIRAKEIDTWRDYENTVRWVKNGFCD